MPCAQRHVQTVSLNTVTLSRQNTADQGRISTSSDGSFGASPHFSSRSVHRLAESVKIVLHQAVFS